MMESYHEGESPTDEQQQSSPPNNGEKESSSPNDGQTQSSSPYKEQDPSPPDEPDPQAFERAMEWLIKEARRARREGRERDLRAQGQPSHSPSAMDLENFTSVPLKHEDEDDEDNDIHLGDSNKENIRWIVLSDKVHPFWQHPFADKSLRPGLEKRMTEEQQAKWLQSSTSWADTPASEWKGVKVLGMGGFGLVGLWKYLGSEPDMPKAIVVKQSPHVDRNLQIESDFLDLLNITGSKHVPKLFRRFHTQAGSGSSEWDLEGRPVSRIYMEYCEHGDMAGFIKKMYGRYSKQNPMPEAYIWRIFECLALALCVVAHGSENLEGPSWRTEIVHFDIKPQNILIGACDEEHPYTGVFKLADYGLAMNVPKDQPPSFLRENAHRGTPDWMAIDQMLEYPMINRRYGTHTNIWVVALCMYTLIMRGRIASASTRVRREIYGRVFLTVGTPIETTSYSRHLKDTILWCLAVNPDDRPAPRQLVKHMQSIIKQHFPEAPPPEQPLHDEDVLLSSYVPQPPNESSSSSLSDLASEFGEIDMANVVPDVGMQSREVPADRGDRRFNNEMESRPRKSLKRSGRYGFEEEGRGGRSKRQKGSGVRKWW